MIRYIFRNIYFWNNIMLSWLILLSCCLSLAFISFVSGFFVVHIGHKHFSRILLVDKDVSLHEFYAFIMKRNFNSKIVTKVLQQFLTLNVRIESVCPPCEDKYRSKKIDHNCIHNGITHEGLLHRYVALSENSEELHD